jgi:UDP-N-acetylmuramoylalanine--D-glutamate ligase
MELKGKIVVVVGLGRSGSAAARLLTALGAVVRVTDRRTRLELIEEIKKLDDLPVELNLGGHPATVFSGAALAVVSPGVPLSSLKDCPVSLIGEVELAYRHLATPVVAITGTNGKSTTTALVGEMLKAWGKRVFVGGNLGTPLCEAALSALQKGVGLDWIVAELSSFQLEAVETFRPRIAVLLNATPNHLDRYKTFSDYLSAKLRIFSRQTENDWAVVNGDDPALRPVRSMLKARVVSFSRIERPEGGFWVEGDQLVSGLDGRRPLIHRSEILLRGEHNLSNVLAACATAQLAGCPTDVIHKTLTRFRGLEHRLEAVGRIREVLYVNDSKATTVEAMLGALRSFVEPIVLIAGGRDKGGDFRSLRPIVADKARATVLIGEARKKIRTALEGTAPIYEAASLKEAVETAASLARPNDVVLLSPGCASFDMFRDFEDRGRQFKDLVKNLGSADGKAGRG